MFSVSSLATFSNLFCSCTRRSASFSLRVFLHLGKVTCHSSQWQHFPWSTCEAYRLFEGQGQSVLGIFRSSRCSWWGWKYCSWFFGGWSIFAIDEVVIGCALDAGIVGALEHKELSPCVAAAVAPIHPIYYYPLKRFSDAGLIPQRWRIRVWRWSLPGGAFLANWVHRFN